MACDVAYKLYFGVAGVKVSCRGIMLAIFQKGVRDITLAHGQQAVYRPFHTLMLGNLSVPAHDYLNRLNGELCSELDMLYAYLEWMHGLFVGLPKTKICNNDFIC